MNTYGYVRVSTVEQNIDRQIIEMHRFGIADKYIFIDKISGKDFNRPRYKSLRRKLRENDLLVVKSIDRLGRNYDEILSEWRYISKEKKADIVVLDMPLLDTRNDNDLTGTLISDIVLQLLSYVAQIERENIKQRQAEGIAAAKAQGVKFGRKPMEYPNNFFESFKEWSDKRITADAAAKQCGITVKQFYWLSRKYRLSLK